MWIWMDVNVVVYVKEIDRLSVSDMSVTVNVGVSVKCECE